MKRQPPKEVPVTELAQDIVYGRGEQNYGHPAENMATIAGLWNAYLQRRGIVDKAAQITERDVALMNALIKVAREAHKHGRDNLVDIAGYAAVADRVVTGD